MALFILLVLSFISERQGVAHAQGSIGTVPPAWPEIMIEPITSGFDRFVDITNAGDGTERLFAVEKPGVVVVLEKDEDGEYSALPTPFLDISAIVSDTSECGLLSLAFSPEYASDGVFYAYYNYDVATLGDLAPPDDERHPNDGCDSVVARFRVSGDPNVADPDSEERLLVVSQPFNNHNGGQLAFGPDGMLYIGLGDGGSGGDPYNQGQTTDALLGKLLRVQVGTSGAYTVPASNPFVDNPAYRPEIWALGLRNPWRFSFDDALGDLYIGDVGQNAYEEINFQPAASGGSENYGWKIMEGGHCYPASVDCSMEGLTLPVVEYGRTLGQSVTGGFVYRGNAWPQMGGIYFYADYASGNIWGLRRINGEWENELLLQTGLNYTLTSFGVDESQELFLAGYNGSVYRLAPAESAPPAAYSTYLPVISR